MNYLFRKNKSNSTGKLLLGTLAGVALGFTAGLLSAPRSGKETREYLSNRTSESLDKIGQNIAEGKKKVAENGKVEVDKLADKLSN